jgi:TRAP transporter TAXI family solute receptor
MCLIVGIMFIPVSEAAVLPQSIELGTHAIGSLHNTMGSGLASVAFKYSGMKVTARPTSGPPAWIPLMSKTGSPDAGLIDVYEAWQSYTGKMWVAPPPPDTPKMILRYDKHDNLRALIIGGNLMLGGIVRNDSGIKTMVDARGKRMSWEYSGFPGNVWVGLTSLASVGMTPKDLRTLSVPGLIEGLEALNEGRVDLAWGAVGSGKVQELDSEKGVHFVPCGSDPILVKKALFFYIGADIGMVKAGITGIKVDTPLVLVPTVVLASTHMSDIVAYTLTKVWWEHNAELGAIHPLLRDWKPERFVSPRSTVPYHPGAIKFYQEKGVWTDKMQEAQKRLLKYEFPLLD